MSEYDVDLMFHKYTLTQGEFCNLQKEINGEKNIIYRREIKHVIILFLFIVNYSLHCLKNLKSHDQEPAVILYSCIENEPMTSQI